MRPRHYRASTNLSVSGVLSVGAAAGRQVSAWPCPMPAACIGTVNNNNVSGITAEGNASCAPGHTGVLCAVCEVGYRRTLRRCERCSKLSTTDSSKSPKM